MGTEEEVESAPRYGGADKTKKRKKKSTNHLHIGPNARAFRAGMAFCPVCDPDKFVRLTEKEREAEREFREATRKQSR